MQQYALGLDVGGTFTDVVLVELDSGRIWTTKTPSTPADPAVGFATGVQKILQIAGVPAASITRVLHGTTVATNAIHEGTGARTGLLTTEGFRHVLEIGRHDVPREANIFSWIKPKRPVPPWLILEVPERIAADGTVLRPLNGAACRDAVRRLRGDGVESIAICFLHSFRNPLHEQHAREIAREEHPEALVSLSHEVLGTFREYERTMATVLNAYLAPKTAHYLDRLEQRLSGHNVRSRLLVMKSNGGVSSVSAAVREPVQLVLSGPAAGVIGATQVGRTAGYDDLIAIDVGGTSADVCLVHQGRATVTTERTIGSFPISLPMIDITTIGAGGGSVAAVSPTGSLSVGPRSAGADPGPACYGKGGAEPTVTDANLILGRIPPYLLGGEIALNLEAARIAIGSRVAEPLGLSLEDAAAGILEILNNNMAGAIRVVSIERGYDPRQFALVSGGGAGPLHAGRLAQLLDIPTIIVPPSPGVLATLGLLASDLKNDWVRTCIQRPPAHDLATIQSVFQTLESEAIGWLEREQVPVNCRLIQRQADLRYRHQGHELSVDCPDGPITDETIKALVFAFHRRHEQLYTFAALDTPVEIVNLRVAAIGLVGSIEPVRTELDASAPAEAQIGERAIHFSDAVRANASAHERTGGSFTTSPVYDRARLKAGMTLLGPAVIEQMDTTTLLLPGQRATVDAFGNLIVTARSG